MLGLEFIIVLLGLGVAAVYLHDIRQTKHTILRNYPVIGHVRYFAETWGEYMRQYQYLPDWAERPFNRLERSWVYRSAKGLSNLISFGSENVPSFIFRNAAFPILDEDKRPYPGKQIGITEGPGASREPYMAKSFFNISGMSYGALSRAAVTSLSRGAKMAGVWMSTGEGGLSQFHLDGGGDLIMQIGTAKYGVRDEHGNLSDDRLREIAAYPQVRMFEVKLAQGAKPGKGGILPAHKVTPEIAKIRGIPEGKDSISPNRHTDIGNIRELGVFIEHVRTVTGKPVGVKFVMGDPGFVDEWFAYCANNPAHCPDYVQIDGGEGGTGAAPEPLADYVGLPITEALPYVAGLRHEYGLDSRIRIIASGKLITPDKVAWALCMGADFISSARGFMFSLGCIQAMKCGTGHCPTGVTAVDERLIKGLDPADKAVRVARYAQKVRDEVEIIAHSCGLTDASHFAPRHVTEIERGVAGFRAQAG
ncbi:FMN-binding glutamate synthase family protein [Acidocella aromatica]|uniref:Glutamate synthase domain-containing protein 2 n=1 Tax=Acidocella aromatica TaxID=1303579 RepID=A0A840V907_9PROT|nr:FMN-binding glutamate synthase family protein [Acidocella aromatica]MBB5372448.1 glutamate synthase domain-containing protein 2 [Acidocella aromatica]